MRILNLISSHLMIILSMNLKKSFSIFRNLINKCSQLMVSESSITELLNFAPEHILMI